MTTQPTGYYGSIPQITQAYQNDPRTKLANTAMALGTSMSPVAGGGWAVPDGLARIAQAVTGALVQKSQDKKYASREQGYMDALRSAAQMASNPAVTNPSTQNPAMAGAAAALGGQPQQAPGNGPPGAMMPPQGGQPPMPPQAPPMAPQQPQGSIGVNAVPSMSGTGIQLDPASLYWNGIRPIEGGTDPKTGAFRTSPKGAVGPGQIMPGTGPEAARLAGVAWDEQKYRSDPKYNDALGAAYYAKQLSTFGDPLKAAAAYNAGPGRVRRALRQGGEQGWTQLLPAETQQYIDNFAKKIGGAGAAGGSPDAGIIAPQMEDVPNAPQGPGQRPDAPQLPGEVQTNRIAMAQQMLSSGNPDMVAIAQDYLNKGLDEQNSARTLASQQQFAQGQTGYQSELNDFNSASQDARQNAYNERTQAQQRNFEREQQFGNRTFQGAQSAANRENALEVAGIKKLGGKDAATSMQDQIDKYYSTGWGSTERQKANEELKNIEDMKASIGQFQALNEKNPTGGIQSFLNDIGINNYRSDYRTMDALSKSATFAKLGGLGRNISDGDRQFVEKANFGIGNPGATNKQITDQILAVANRRQDYVQNQLVARAVGKSAEFDQNWDKYVRAVSIFGKDRKVDMNAPTFEQWSANPAAFKGSSASAGSRVQRREAARSSVNFGGKSYKLNPATGKWEY